MKDETRHEAARGAIFAVIASVVFWTVVIVIWRML